MQCATAAYDLEKTLAKLHKFTKEASEAGSELVVFPEALYGFHSISRVVLTGTNAVLAAIRRGPASEPRWEIGLQRAEKSTFRIITPQSKFLDQQRTELRKSQRNSES